jgi:hypothetical protein
MDPITGVGAAASVAQLLALCVKSSQAAKELWESYSDAPGELRRLVEKIDFLKAIIEQFSAVEGHLSTDHSDGLLPEVHRIAFLAVLRNRATQLEQLRSLQRDRRTFGSRIRWALLNESRATRILKAVTDIGNDLNLWLNVMQM